MVRITLNGEEYKARSDAKLSKLTNTTIKFIKQARKTPNKVISFVYNGNFIKRKIKDIPNLITEFIPENKEKTKIYKDTINALINEKTKTVRTKIGNTLKQIQDPTDIEFKGTIDFDYYRSFSPPEYTFMKRLTVVIRTPIKNDGETLADLIYETVREYDEGIQDYIDGYNIGYKMYETLLSGYILIKNIELRQNYQSEPVFFDGFIMKEETPIKLNVFTQNVKNDKVNHCVKDYLRKCKIGKKIIEQEFKTNDGITTTQLKKFCVKYSIPLKAYDLTGKIISEHRPEQPNKKYSSVNYAVFNNHLYPIHKKFKFELNEFKYTGQKIIYDKNFNANLTNLLNTETPEAFHIQNTEIQAYLYKNIIYTNDERYSLYLSYAKKLGLEEVFTNNLSVLSRNLLKKYANVSVFPYEYKIQHITFNNDIEHTEENTICVDKNKCFTHALETLPYIINADITHKPPQKYNGEEIIEDFIYYVKPKHYSLWFPNTSYYMGSTILEANKFDEIDYEILEYVETSQYPNTLKTAIDIVYKNLPEKDAKYVINSMIGLMQPSIKSTTIKQKIKRISTNEEIEGFHIKINNKYSLIYDTEKKDAYHIKNYNPISIQIADNYRINFIKTLYAHNIKNEDIVSIKTDAITYIKNKHNEIIKTSNERSGWKKQEYKPYTAPELINKETASFMDIFKNDNVLVDAWAGTGKTYEIINKIIPSIQKNNYKVFTPTHKASREYLEKSLNADVITKYVYNKDTITEKNIIIDEYGMLDKNAHLMLMKYTFEGYKIYMYGDHRQLTVDNHVNYEFIKLMFPNHRELTENKRNTFSITYYKYLLSIKDRTELIKEIEKYQQTIQEAEYVICYRNDTVKKYNKIKSELLGIKSPTQPGAKIIIRTNGIKNFCNTEILTVRDTDENYIYFVETSKKMDIETYKKNFNSDKIRYAYALTLHSLQGSSIASYHYAKEDYDFINNTVAYVCISRIKTLCGQTKITDYLP